MNKIVSAAQKDSINQLRVKWEIQAKSAAREEIEASIRFHESATKKPFAKDEKQG